MMYKDGPNGDAFYDRYKAFGQQKFDEIGFFTSCNSVKNS